MMEGKDPKRAYLEDLPPQYAASATQQHIEILFPDPGQIIIPVSVDEPALRDLRSDVKLLYLFHRVERKSPIVAPQFRESPDYDFFETFDDGKAEPVEHPSEPVSLYVLPKSAERTRSLRAWRLLENQQLYRIMPGTFAPTKDVVDKAGGLSPIVEDVADAQLLHSVPWGLVNVSSMNSNFTSSAGSSP